MLGCLKIWSYSYYLSGVTLIRGAVVESYRSHVSLELFRNSLFPLICAAWVDITAIDFSEKLPLPLSLDVKLSNHC